VTGPVNVASVTTAPSPIRALVIVTRGGAGRGLAGGEVVARVPVVAAAGRDGDGADCTGVGEPHAARAHTLATVAAAQSLSIVLPVPATIR